MDMESIQDAEIQPSQENLVAQQILKPNTTLYPVPIVLITTGGEHPNVMTGNRIASCSAEPPRGTHTN